MVQFKVLILVSLVITTLSSCEKRNPNSKKKNEQKETLNKNIIIINTTQYDIVEESQNIIDIEIKDKLLLQSIYKVINPIFKIEYHNKYILIKGNNIFNSTVPDEFEYFYPMDSENKVILNEGILNIRKIG